MSKIKEAHDTYFKELLSKKQNARDFLEGILPQKIKDKIDLSQIQYENTSYTSPGLNRTYSDIIYSVEYRKEKIKIALLMEHKSFRPECPYLQLLQYIINGTSLHIKQTMKWESKEPYPLIIPIIIYHGRDNWQYKTFSSYYGKILPEFRVFFPEFSHLILDLKNTHSRDELDKLFSNQHLKIAFLVEKYIYNPGQLLIFLEKFFDMCQIYNEPEEIDFIISTLGVLNKTPSENNIFRNIHFCSSKKRDTGKNKPHIKRKREWRYYYEYTGAKRKRRI